MHRLDVVVVVVLPSFAISLACFSFSLLCLVDFILTYTHSFLRLLIQTWTEQDFVAHENPINKRPIKLWSFALETDSRKFSKSVTSIQVFLRLSFIFSPSLFSLFLSLSQILTHTFLPNSNFNFLCHFSPQELVQVYFAWQR